LLDDNRPFTKSTALNHIAEAQLYKVTASKLCIQGAVEHG
jgi:hypothetical protein